MPSVFRSELPPNVFSVEVTPAEADALTLGRRWARATRVEASEARTRAARDSSVGLLVRASLTRPTMSGSLNWLSQSPLGATPATPRVAHSSGAFAVLVKNSTGWPAQRAVDAGEEAHAATIAVPRRRIERFMPLVRLPFLPDPGYDGPSRLSTRNYRNSIIVANVPYRLRPGACTQRRLALTWSRCSATRRRR